MAKKFVRTDIKELVLARVEKMLSKPRITAHSPLALAEVVYACLNLVYEDKRYERYMNYEYPGSKPWYFDDNLDFQIAALRLQKLVMKLRDE